MYLIDYSLSHCDGVAFTDMTSAQFRLANARAWAKEVGGITGFADKAGMSVSQASQIIGEHPTRAIGTRLARRIEEAFEKGHGALDHPPVDLYTEQAVVGPNGDRIVPAAQAAQFALIPVYPAVVAAAGSGRVNDPAPVEDRLAFRRDWLAKKGLLAGTLKAISAEGKSMEDRIHDGDTLLIDTSHTRVVDGKVYAVQIGDELRVKRIFTRIGGGLRMKSDNPEYGQDEVPLDAMDTVKIIGRVVWIGGDV